VRVYVDTNVLIPAMEGTGDDASQVARLIDLGARAKLELITSEMTLSEVLVVPIRRDDDILVDAYLTLLMREPVFTLVPVTRDILVESSRIRARGTEKLPDSVHVATAVLQSCDIIASYDRRLGGLSGIEVVEPSDARFLALDEEAS